MRAWREFFSRRLAEISFYIGLDAVTAAATYIVSYGEPGLYPGQLMVRMLGAMLLVNGLVGGPDTMMYWKESGRRIEAEKERDAAVARSEKVVQERNEAEAKAAQERNEAEAKAAQERNEAEAKAAQERAGLEKQVAERDQEIQALRAQIDEIQNERNQRRRARRRRLRDVV